MSDSSVTLYALRPLEKTDLPIVAGWFQDVDDLAAFDRLTRVPLGLDACERAWEGSLGNAPASGRCWFKVEAETGNAVGIVGLEGISPVNRDAVIPLFVEKAARRTGIGIRAVALVLDLGFRQLGLNRITSYYRADNEKSRKLTTRLGFEVEGRMREAWFADGRHFDMLAVGLLRNEWLTRREALARELDRKTIVTLGGGVESPWAWPPRDARPA